MKFVVGIGNPEKKYEKTRHNIGFRALEGLVERWEAKNGKALRSQKKFESEIFTTDSALLIKPLTYVNRTGDSVSLILRKYNALPSDFLFLCDDVNLAFGKMRLRSSGSAGGHHGLESVIQAFQSPDFSRLRIGVKNPSMPQDLTDFVLGKFDGAEIKKLPEILDGAASVCESWVENGFHAAQSRLSVLQSK